MDMSFITAREKEEVLVFLHFFFASTRGFTRAKRSRYSINLLLNSASPFIQSESLIEVAVKNKSER